MSLQDVIKVQNWIQRIMEDTLTKIFLNNSQFTEIQLETLLIDFLAEQILEKKTSDKEKVKFRIDNKKISRGSFNRTLQQAKNNINKSIFSIFLLAYLGVLETTSLRPLLELSNKLETLMREYHDQREIVKENPEDQNANKLIIIIQNEIKNIIYELIAFKK